MGVIFNMTERVSGLENGKQMRALQPHEMFVSQCYITAVYRSELALRLENLGYELERAKHGQAEIRGYSKEYLEASSPRRRCGCTSGIHPKYAFSNNSGYYGQRLLRTQDDRFQPSHPFPNRNACKNRR
jgi:hypothetical protein